MTGVVVFHAGAPIFWAAIRQAVMTLSTAEAERAAQLEALIAGQSVPVVLVLLTAGFLIGECVKRLGMEHVRRLRGMD